MIVSRSVSLFLWQWEVDQDSYKQSCQNLKSDWIHSDWRKWPHLNNLIENVVIFIYFLFFRHDKAEISLSCKMSCGTGRLQLRTNIIFLLIIYESL